MESYRTFNADYRTQGVFYSQENDEGASYKKTSPREKPVYWARDSQRFLEKHQDENVPRSIREQRVGPGERVFTKKRDDPCVSR